MSIFKLNKTKTGRKFVNKNSLVTHPIGETMMIFQASLVNKSARTTFAIGWVDKITIGDEFDIVELDVGKKMYRRRVICALPDARKQIYTLKQNQLCMVYGKLERIEIPSPVTEHRKKVCVIVAYGLQGWYVPKAFDRKVADTSQFEYNHNKEGEKDILSQFEKK